MQDLAETTALITGASSGIGAATASVLARRGCTVVAVARRSDRLGRVVSAITASGGKALAMTCDVADADEVEDVVFRAAEHLGRLDILVNNAGVMYLGRADEAPRSEWDEMVQVNVSGLLNVTHAALPYLLHAASHGPRRVADLVNVSSVGGRRASAGTAVYNATKFAVSGLSEALRQEFGRRHLRVSSIEPGMVATEVMERSRPGALEAVLEEFGRDPGEVERLRASDVADTIAFVVGRPRHVAIADVLLRPTEQL
jgi:NADP-dependent 3-hydroxy acid dehydrogenase YdfG